MLPLAETIGRFLLSAIDMLLPRIVGASDKVAMLRWIEAEIGKKAANVEAQIAHDKRLRATGKTR